MVKLTILAGPDQGSVFTLEGDLIAIGRSRGCDVILHDEFVGGRHCTITRQGDRFILTDLGSRNKTFLNEQRDPLSTPYLLDAVAEIRLGPKTRIRIELVASRGPEDQTLMRVPGTETSQPSFSPTSHPLGSLSARPNPLKSIGPSDAPIMISVVSGPDRGMSYSPSKEELTIGRSETCDIVLHDPLVSRVHATIEREGDGYCLHDEDSVNGTFLRAPDARIFATAELANGDIIYIGQTQLRVEMSSGAPATASGDDATIVSAMLGGKKFSFTLMSPLRSARQTQLLPVAADLLLESRESERPVTEEPEVPQGGEQELTSSGATYPWIKLRVITGSSAGAEFSPSPDVDSFTVGRGQDVDFRINEQGVSRRHFAVEREKTAWVLVDLDSLNGVFVNDGPERVKRLPLTQGDEIRLHNTRIQVELPVAEERTSLVAPPSIPPPQNAPLGEPSQPASSSTAQPVVMGEPSANPELRNEVPQSRSALFKERLAKIQKQKGVTLKPFTIPGTVRHWATLFVLLFGAVCSYPES